ncbi:MAG: Hsp20/alpha crystallin family protein [Saprospiraceae bacterium]|nr:Hsp20/alpha crystallin family protein [Saprospiraceae bacterium]
MSVKKYYTPLFPRWSNFFEGINPEARFLGYESDFSHMPATNIEEKGAEFVVTMAIPGVNKEDINIEVHDNVISISSEKEASSEEKEKNYSRKEYSYNSFKRVFNLPQNVREEDIEALYENGELILHLPKAEAEEKKVKKIEVA